MAVDQYKSLQPLTLFLCLCMAASICLAREDKIRAIPIFSVDARSFGLNPITEKDFKRLDHEFFARRDIQMLESFDFHVRMEFVSENTIAVS
jgi:hypothetical protein